MNSARDQKGLHLMSAPWQPYGHAIPREPAHFAKKAGPGTIALSRAVRKPFLQALQRRIL